MRAILSRLLSLVTAILCTGGTIRATAQAPTARLVLIPLDDRPSSLDFPVRLGAIAGAEVLTPPRALLGRFTQPADADGVSDWLRMTLVAPSTPEVDALIVSLDLLAYGGLVASRTSATATSDQAIARLAILTEIRRRHPRLPIYASASLMRLAPTADGRNEAYREALARWAELLPDSLQPAVREERRTLETRLPATVRSEYLTTRARNLRVHRAAMALVESGVVTHLVFTQDDARARGVHREEREALVDTVASRHLGERISIQSGTDEFGMLLVARALTERHGAGPTIAVTYVAPADSARPMPFEDRPLAETVRAHLRLVGARVVGPANVEAPREVALQLIVYTARTTRGGATRSTEGSTRAATLVRESPHPVILADIDPTGSIQGADTTLTDLLVASGRFATLTGYGAWNTAGNAVGTAIAHGVVRWLAEHEASAASAADREVAQAVFLLDRWLDDDLYKSRIRPRVVASIRARGWDPFRLTATQTVTIEGEIRAAVRDRVATTTHLTGVIGARCRVTSPVDIRLPWGRTFEAALHFTLRCD